MTLLPLPNRRFLLLLATLCLLPGYVLAEPKLASVFTTHMVLQRDTKISVWGTASPGEELTLSFADQTKSAKANSKGEWRLELAPLAASAQGRTLKLSGSTSHAPVEIEDIMVGEVWLASGQSNMDFTVARTPKYYFAGVTNEEQEVAAANHPRIRMFTGEWTRSYEPKREIDGTWKVCTPETVREFSAIGYFFARELANELGIPVGILTLTYGASTAQAWIRREAIAANPRLKPELDRFDELVKAYRPPSDEDLNAWRAAAEKAKANGRRPPARPHPEPVQDQHNPTVMYNGMIAPCVGFPMRGVIWYQGESITGPRELFPLWNETLVRDWRELWGHDFPFYFCQLAAHKTPPDQPGPSSIAEVREMQTQLLSLPNTGMALTIDIGDEKNVHPRNKQEAGARLAKLALAQTYGRKLVCSGPLFESMRVTNGVARVHFSHADGGLVGHDGPLKQFAISGADGHFVCADAKIEGESVLVSNPAIPVPANVRYAWADNPAGCNLYNGAGLPAAPFRTDKSKP
jgi:sialate O-acetylesterase